MKTINRRELCVALSAMAAVGGGAVESAAQQASPMPGQPYLAQSKTFPLASLPVKTNANGVASRAVTHGTLATGEAVEVHETTLPPGEMPHPAHRHRHSEFMMVREGKLEFDNDGTKEIVGPGGVIFAASNLMHGLKNIGDTPANYFVIAIGEESGVKPV